MTSTANDKEGSRLAAVSRPLRHATVRGLSGPRTIVIFLRRDFAEGSIFRTSLMLDLGFGLPVEAVGAASTEGTVSWSGLWVWGGS